MIKNLSFLLICWLSIALSALAENLTEQYVNLNGEQIHYYHMGKGSPIILLTGYATTSNFWNKDFVACLAKKHAVYLIDYKGINVISSHHTNSSIKEMAIQIKDTQKKLSLEKTAIIGWSMGGAVALEMAHRFPEDVSKLVLLAPLTPHATHKTNKSPTHFKNAFEVLDYVFNNNIYQYLPSQRTEYAHSLVDQHKMLFPNKIINAEQMTAIKNWQSSSVAWQHFFQTQTPALFIISDHDKILNPSSILQDANAYPHAVIVFAKNSSHDVSLQHPQWTCEKVNHFLT